MRVLLLSGSVGKKSCTRALLKHVENLLKEKDIETMFWDLGEKPLPIAVPEYYIQPEANPERSVGEFVRAVKDVEALVLGSPLYYGSYSGVIKNALDNLSPNALFGKAVGLVSHSSNARSCVKPCYDLRPVVVSLGTYPVICQVGSTDSDFIYDEDSDDFLVSDEGVKKRANDMIAELMDLTEILSPRRSKKV